MDISVVIVNYRVKYFLDQTLRSVEQALAGHTSEVFVVDNCSQDDSIAFCRERHPDVTYIENKENVGFARANNQAIMRAKGDFTLILNPDTIITPACIDSALAWMNDHAGCGAIGMRMLDGNGTFLPESKRAFPTPWVSFCKIFGLSKLFPRSRWFAKYHLRYLSDLEPQKVDILSGACMFCRTELLQRLGGFDEDFFMYGEDIDLSYRIVKSGAENWFLPVDMIHYKGESTHKGSMRYVRVFYNAMLIFYRKHFPRFSCVLYPIIKLGVALRAGVAIMARLWKRLVGKSDKTEPADTAWYIVASDPAEVARRAGIANVAGTMPETTPLNVLIDDKERDYEQIVRYIAEHQRKGRYFHIFADRHGVVISPKMNN